MNPDSMTASDWLRWLRLIAHLTPLELSALATSGGIQVTIQTGQPLTIDVYLPPIHTQPSRGFRIVRHADGAVTRNPPASSTPTTDNPKGQ